MLASSYENMDCPENSYLYFLGFCAATGLLSSEITDLLPRVNMFLIPHPSPGHVRGRRCTTARGKRL